MTKLDQKTFTFSSFKRRIVKARFDGGSISSDGGMLLVREADKRMGLTVAASKCLDDKRQKGKVEHPLLQLLRQRVYGLACGYEDTNDFETLREDPLWQSLCEKDTRLAGKSTLGRFENAMDRNQAVKINELFIELFINSYSFAPAQIILDFDATDNRVHGHQEGRFFHGYYDSYCFLPLYVFCQDKLLCAYLRPSNQDAATHAGAILKLIVKRLRQVWPHTQIIFRADSGFCRDLTLSWCDRHGIDYCVGLARNAALIREAEPYLEQARKDYEITGFVPNVIFPCATLHDAESGKITIYYGAADTYTALAFTQVDELITYMKANSEV